MLTGIKKGLDLHLLYLVMALFNLDILAYEIARFAFLLV